MSAPKKKGKKRQNMMKTRKGAYVVLILAILIFIVSAISLSFSWFSPGVKKGSGMGFDADISMRSENCSFVTQVSNAFDNTASGTIVFDNEALTSGSYTVAVPSSGAKYKLQYFRTTITNNSDYPTNVSLYLSQFPGEALNTGVNANSGQLVGIGVATPSNTYRTVFAQQQDYYIIRNLFVPGKQSGEENSTVVEWFVRTSNTAATVDLSNLYLMYN